MVDASSHVDLFVSHAGRDRAWAEWVAWQLTQAGFNVELDTWDWGAGDNFVERMNAALIRADRIVVVVSAAYFHQDRFTAVEWTAVMADPANRRGRLVPVRVEDVPMPPVWRPLVCRDLFGLNDEQARMALLEAVGGSVRPTSPPAFPGPGLPVPLSREPRLPGSLPPVWNAPSRSAAFTGRDDLLVELRHILLTSSSAVIGALHGMGGVGKTQLAVEYAHRFAGEYDLVWWVNAEQSHLIADQLATCAVEAGLVEPGTATPTAVKALSRHLRSRSGWLVVFDNATTATEIVANVPQGPGHVLVTSRSPAWSGAAVTLAVDVFSRTESVALTTRLRPMLSSHDADRLAHALGDLPLALAQAAGVMTETGMSAEEYLAALASAAPAVLDIGTPTGYPTSLAAAVRVAMDNLAAEDSAAAHCARLCALLGPEPIPLWLFSTEPQTAPEDLRARAALERLALRQCVGRAARYGLVKADGDTATMHRLTQAIVAASLTDADHEAIRQEVQNLLIAGRPDRGDDVTLWPRWSQLLPHILAADPAETTNARLRQLANDAIRYLRMRGDARTSLVLAEQLYDRWCEKYGPDEPTVLAAANALANASYRLV